MYMYMILCIYFSLSIFKIKKKLIISNKNINKIDNNEKSNQMFKRIDKKIDIFFYRFLLIHLINKDNFNLVEFYNPF